jgi:hypothetical protein
MAMENNFSAVMVRLGDGAGGFGAEHRFNLGGTDRPNAVIAKDLNADGRRGRSRPPLPLRSRPDAQGSQHGAPDLVFFFRPLLFRPLLSA